VKALILFLVAAGLWVFPANAQVNVTQFHNHASRDGLYVDSAFTLSAAANLTRDRARRSLSLATFFTLDMAVCRIAAIIMAG